MVIVANTSTIILNSSLTHVLSLFIQDCHAGKVGIVFKILLGMKQQNI